MSLESRKMLPLSGKMNTFFAHASEIKYVSSRPPTRITRVNFDEESKNYQKYLLVHARPDEQQTENFSKNLTKTSCFDEIVGEQTIKRWQKWILHTILHIYTPKYPCDIILSMIDGDFIFSPSLLLVLLPGTSRYEYGIFR